MARPATALLMFLPYRHAEQRILASVAAAGYDDITLAQARVMARIGPDGTRLTELAEAGQITKQSAGFLVDQLERAGYVERVPDPRDARARLVRIATRGREAQAVARETEAVIEREWQRHLGRQRMAALREALESLREITDPWA
ncbi:MAG TPA: MarR family transcriptional regulator [Marmoricola sp.]|nr:MarR family transcriptional regulator [Marmoricola sp.]